MQARQLITFCFLLLFAFAGKTFSQQVIDDETNRKILSPDTTNNSWFNGEWAGTGYQVGNIKWEVKLKISSANDISIEYPDLSCKGKWTRKGNGYNSVQLEEHVESGIENCIQGSKVYVKKISGNEIKVFYFIKTLKKDVYANAVLKKIN